MNKKGTQSFNYLHWIVRLIYLIIVLVSVVLLIRMYSMGITDSEELEANIFVQRLLYSPNGISEYDETIGRVYPGIIDLDRLNETFLASALNYGEENNYISAQIILYERAVFAEDGRKYKEALKTDADAELSQFVRNTKSVIEPVYYNKIWYERWLPRAVTGATGRGGAQRFEKTYPVLYRKEKELVSGQLLITVVIPNA